MSYCGRGYGYEEENKEAEPFRILVVGECGDGKSMFIKAWLKTYGGKWTKQLHSGVAAKGVSKEVVPYPFTFGGRPAIIFDTPGIGDGNIKIPELVALIETALKSGPNKSCHAVVICSKMPNNRVGLGAQIVASLIKAGMVEKNKNRGVHENIVFVGTQQDLYVCNCRTEAKKKRKIAVWDSEIPPDMNRRCGFTGKDSIRVCHSSIIMEDDATINDPDIFIDIAEPSKALLEIMKAGKSVEYHKPPSKDLLRMLAKETGLEADEQELTSMAADLEAAREQIDRMIKQQELENKKKNEGGLWGKIMKTVTGATLGFVAGGPFGAAVGGMAAANL